MLGSEKPITAKGVASKRESHLLTLTPRPFRAVLTSRTGPGTFLKGRIAMGRVEAAAHLVALKNKYDPENRFRLNQNVQPTAKR